MSKSYSRIELMDWVIRNRNGLSANAHHIAITLSQLYIDYNGRNRFKYWGEVRVLHADLVEMTGLSLMSVRRAVAELNASGMWSYKAGRKGVMSVFVPLMKVTKVEAQAPIKEEGEVVELNPSTQEDPFGYSEAPKVEKRELSITEQFQRERAAQEKLLTWEQIHNDKFSIFPLSWRGNAKNAKNETILGTNHLLPADRNKLLHGIALLRARGWSGEAVKNFIQNHPISAAELKKDYVAYVLYLFKTYAATANPQDYISVRSAV